MRHTLINFPTRTIQRCTRCGIIKKTNRDGNYGVRYYKNGEDVTEKNHECKLSTNYNNEDTI